jgi:RNA polymerase sigma factor (sigma-70 family)
MHEFEQDAKLVSECLTGKEEAWLRLREVHWLKLRSILCARGASVADAEEVLADLWPDLGCIVPGRVALLARYNAAGPLSSWLATVAIHRYVNRRRKSSYGVVSISQVQLESAMPESTTRDADRPLLAETMLRALRSAWEATAPDARLMLLLVHIHGIKQREIAALWGWNESKVSRSLASAMEGISQAALENLNRQNPGIAIEWSDFLQLSEISPDLFMWSCQ